jgi:hypothetical protein
MCPLGDEAFPLKLGNQEREQPIIASARRCDGAGQGGKTPQVWLQTFQIGPRDNSCQAHSPALRSSKSADGRSELGDAEFDTLELAQFAIGESLESDDEDRASNGAAMTREGDRQGAAAGDEA